MANKSGYEIRLQLLQLATEILAQKVQAQAEPIREKMFRIGKSFDISAYPDKMPSYTEDEVMMVASKLYGFVSSKQLDGNE